MLGFPGGPQRGHRGGLARPRRPDEHVEPSPGGGDLLDRHGLVEGNSMVPAGQGGLRHGRHGAHGDDRTVGLSTRLEQAGLGLQEGGRGVDLVTLGPESGRPIGPAEPFGRVVQLRRRDQKRLGQRQVRRPLGDGDPVLRGGEADPVELAVHLGQDVGPGEGGPALGHAVTATPAASSKMPSARSPACSSGRSLRSASPATQETWSPPM